MCWEYQQDFHVEGEERDIREEECSNIGSVSLGYDHSWVQGIKVGTVEPVSP